MESVNPSAESAAESVPVMDELSSEPEPEESPVMVAGSSTAVMNVPRLSVLAEMAEVPPLVETSRVEPAVGALLMGAFWK